MAHHMVLGGGAETLVSVREVDNKSLLRRLYDRYVDAMVASHHARNDSEIGRYIAARGGVLTDDVEREISRRFGSGIVGG